MDMAWLPEWREPDGDRCAGESVAMRDLTQLMMRHTGKPVATGVSD